MFLAGGLTGLMAGACIGVVIAGLLLQGRQDDPAETMPPPIYNKHSRGFWLAVVVAIATLAGWWFHLLGVTP